jgi:hypothetical protein
LTSTSINIHTNNTTPVQQQRPLATLSAQQITPAIQTAVEAYQERENGSQDGLDTPMCVHWYNLIGTFQPFPSRMTAIGDVSSHEPVTGRPVHLFGMSTEAAL